MLIRVPLHDRECSRLPVALAVKLLDIESFGGRRVRQRQRLALEFPEERRKLALEPCKTYSYHQTFLSSLKAVTISFNTRPHARSI
jgi:hypothetical protein